MCQMEFYTLDRNFKYKVTYMVNSEGKMEFAVKKVKVMKNGNGEVYDQQEADYGVSMKLTRDHEMILFDENDEVAARTGPLLKGNLA